MYLDLVRLGMPLWSAAAILVLVIAAAVIDIKAARVPSCLTYPAMLGGLALHGLLGGWSGDGGQIGLSGALAGLAVGAGPMLLCWIAGGIGGGDVKLMGAIGVLGGWKFVVATMMYGFIAAALMAVVVMVHRRMVRRTLRRIGAAVVLLLTPGAPRPEADGSESPTVPFAVALALGAMAAMIERILFPGTGLPFGGG